MNPLADLELKLLGGFRAVVRGQLVEPPSGSARLLAVLALTDADRTRAKIAGTLWPDISDRRALANLRDALWRMPRLLRGYLAANSASVRLRPSVVVDVDDATRLALRILNGGDVSEIDIASLELLSTVLLPDWDEDWLLFERERLRQRQLHALETLAERHLARFAPRYAVDAALAAVAAEPYRESAHALLIRAHTEAGNRTDAARCYQSYRELMQDELGLDVVPELSEIVQARTR